MKKERYIAYVGTYTNGQSVGIQIFDIDPATGLMQPKGAAEVCNPSALVVSHSGKYLYSIADMGVQAFKILPDGALEFINIAPTGGMRGCDICIDKKDRYVFVAGYHDGRVSMLKVNEDGSIGDIADGVFHKGIGVSIIDKNSMPHVTDVTLTPDEKYLCAVDQGLNQTQLYEIDYEEGKLKRGGILRCQLDASPRKLLFGKDGKFAYLLCEGLVCVNVYSYDNTDGPGFKMIDSYSTLYKNDPDRCAPFGMDISDDGKHLFCSNAGTNTAIIFEIDQKKGLLSEICHTKISGNFPKAICAMPDGKHFLSLNHDANEIVNFEVNYEKNYFLLKGKPISVESPNNIVIHKLK